MRKSRKDLDRACEALTDLMHREGGLHPESRFEAGSRYGYYAVEVTGGPYYGSGVDVLITGCGLGEAVEAVWAITRAHELARRSARAV